MKKPLLAALAGFVLAFSAGAASTRAEAAPTAPTGQTPVRCTNNAQCGGYGGSMCGGYAMCWLGYCVCS